jgi:hypothetical protein
MIMMMIIKMKIQEIYTNAFSSKFLQELSLHYKIILKWVLKKQHMHIGPGFMWH